jgi:hypothetical protein
LIIEEIGRGRKDKNHPGPDVFHTIWIPNIESCCNWYEKRPKNHEDSVELTWGILGHLVFHLSAMRVLNDIHKFCIGGYRSRGIGYAGGSKCPFCRKARNGLGDGGPHHLWSRNGSRVGKKRLVTDIRYQKKCKEDKKKSRLTELRICTDHSVYVGRTRCRNW